MRPMNDKELYSELGNLTKRKEDWKDNISFVGTLLENQLSKITAKALWLLGEMGLQYPHQIEPYVPPIASYLISADDLLRERALNALGRIGRADFNLVKPYIEEIFKLATDNAPQVRLSFIWASENIATNTPDTFQNYLPIYEKLLNDSFDKVRMEAPEMFRVMGKRHPQWVKPYLAKLQHMADNDPNPVVRIHSAGAIRITNNTLKYCEDD